MENSNDQKVNGKEMKEKEVVKSPKKNLLLYIILGIVSFLFISFICLVIVLFVTHKVQIIKDGDNNPYTPEIVEDKDKDGVDDLLPNDEKGDESNEEKVENTPDEVSIKLVDGKELVVNIENSECDNTGFQIIEHNEKMTRYADNQNMYCSSWYELEYFVDENAMTNYYSKGTAKYPLEAEIIEGVTYTYIAKYEGETEDDWGYGLAYQWFPVTKVKGYEASKIVSYENRLYREANIKEGALKTNLCVFNLNKVDNKLSGYLVFSGAASYGSEVNYCNDLSDMETFGLKLGL